MSFALRHPVSLVVLIAALTTTVGIFGVARPEYHPRYESKMIDFSKVHHYNPSAVRSAFAEHGVTLRSGTAPTGMTWFGHGPAPFSSDSLQVIVGPRRGSGSWGPEIEAYDTRFGNVLVTYGGRDQALLARVKTAVSDLR